MYRNSNQLRYNVVALWSQAGLRKFVSRKMCCESVKKRMCLSEASSCALAFGGHFLANLLQPGYFLFASFLFRTSEREMKKALAFDSGAEGNADASTVVSDRSGAKEA